jgi:hypothetical protein
MSKLKINFFLKLQQGIVSDHQFYEQFSFPDQLFTLYIHRVLTLAVQLKKSCVAVSQLHNFLSQKNI